MELIVLERLALLNILPRQGNATTLKILRVFREDLSFSEEEHASLNFREEGGNLKWTDNGLVKDVQIGSKLMALVIETLEKLNETKELPEEALSLYEKFVETTD